MKAQPLPGTGNSIDGLVLSPGSILTGTGTLTMSGFKTALTAEDGLNHHRWHLCLGTTQVPAVRELHGDVSGSNSTRTVTITADDKSNTNFF